VPTFTCGFVRSNFALDTVGSSLFLLYVRPYLAYTYIYG